MFFGPPAFQLRSKIDKKASPDRSKFKQKICQHLDPFLMDFGTNLGRFGEAFGGQVGAMLAPNGIKTWPQNQSKKRLLFGRPPERILIIFLWILGPTWGGPGGSNEPAFWWLVGSWSQVAPKTSPRAPQDAPRAPKSPILEDFWRIFSWFLFDF